MQSPRNTATVSFIIFYQLWKQDITWANDVLARFHQECTSGKEYFGACQIAHLYPDIYTGIDSVKFITLAIAVSAYTYMEKDYSLSSFTTHHPDCSQVDVGLEVRIIKFLIHFPTYATLGITAPRYGQTKRIRLLSISWNPSSRIQSRISTRRLRTSAPT